MKYFVSFIVFFYVGFSCKLAAQNKLNITIQQVNVMSGKSVLYKIHKQSIDVFSGSFKKSSYQCTFSISKGKTESISKIISSIKDKWGSTNLSFANYSILDGFYWKLTIKSRDTEQVIRVKNCHFVPLDEILNILNQNIKGCDRITNTGEMFADSQCN